MISNLMIWLQSSEGWKRRGILLLLGAITSLCQAPFDLFPLLWISFPALIWMLDSTKRNEDQKISFKSAFATGWYFSFGYYGGSLWWLASPFLVRPEIHGWMVPFVVIVIPAIISLFWTLAIAIASKFWFPDWRRILVFAVAFSFGEFLKSNMFSGFPWLSIGYAFLDAWVLGQFAAVVALYGLNFLAVLIFSAPAALVNSGYSNSAGGRYLNIFAVFCLIIMAGFGLYRLHPSQAVPDTEHFIRIVQPKISQKDKWNPEKREEIIQKFITLSKGSNDSESSKNPNQTVVIYPEAALPALFSQKSGQIEKMSELIPDNHFLITGAVRKELRDGKNHFYNSMFAFDSEGVIQDYYDKVHLIPLGEYIPFQSTLERFGIRALTRFYSSLTAGEIRKDLHIPGIPIASPVICYEITFPGAVMPVTAKAEWIINITNDSWIGTTPGTYQHFEQTRMRAIEEGVPAIRAANTGISGIIDSNGRVRELLAINEIGYIEGYLPAIHSTEMFQATRNYGFFGMLLIAIALCFSKSLIGNRNSTKFSNNIKEEA